MPPKPVLKEIPIEQLLPGMFMVEMDVPWYRTPFLFHKRLVKDSDTIRLMKEHGIRHVTIDTSKGADVPAEAVKASPSDASPAHSEQDERGLDTIAAFAATGLSEPTVHQFYAEVHQAAERIFADLEQGVPPPPAATKVVVNQVLSRIMKDRAGLLTQLAVQKIKQFDRSLAAHGLDTCVLSLIVAVESGLDESLLVHLGIGALLHDAGYVRLPRNLVRRRWDCTETERLLLEQHPKLGLVLLSDQPDLHQDVKRIVAEHHERGNGGGFPAGMNHDGIFQAAAIVGIVDFYDGMVSRRSGRPAMLPHDAIRQLFLAGERGEFQRGLVEVVIRSIGVYPVGSLVRLNTGEQAVVVGVNPGQRLKPLVKITGGPQGESYANPVELDLAEQPPDRSVRTVLRVLDPAQERVNVAMYLDDHSTEAA